mmetsp:Transcript_15723/g.30371  ORF Transcript_15723/g.30371 Transcript_15723/m.30371 type:complete len:444 (-) Transcript_15723:323-1654(-)|eukprot:CAMPEP_0171544736 /NCGR_PEP_ID=MMETSP0960-20121227/3674_1 /TAXON_ID=87120 /ORGANISM="Aurantiochytrium limacinum, Strain ATCCMYA-1381" /LENGTH=443 /DNA_ID=CAMNT_0012092593 /DNA_START=80 /DNA_END=1411 /DNA_ORIENTATION=-
MQRELVNTHLEGDKRVQVWHAQRPTFRGESTTQAVYQAYGAEHLARKQDVAPPGNLATDKNGKFYGNTTTRDTYTPHRIEPHRVVSEEKYQPSNATFYSSTTSGDSYIPHNVERTKSLAPARMVPPNMPFYGTTTTRDTYTPHQGGSRPEPSTVARSTNVKVGMSSQFYSDTTTRGAFGAPGNQELAKPIRPSSRTLQDVMPADQRFLGRSTSQDTFVAHDVAPRVLPQSIAWEPNKAYFYGTTTAKDSYPAYPPQPVERGHGPQHSAVSDAPFQDATEARERFTAPGANGRTQPIVPRGNLQVNHGYFNGVSTSRDTFQGWQLPVQRLPIGLETVNDNFHTMIPQRQRLPAEHSQVFTTVTDGQTSVQITVRQGTSPRASDNDILASFELVGIDPQPCGTPQILVTFSVNEQSRLHIDAVDQITGKAQHIAIDRDINSTAFA